MQSMHNTRVYVCTMGCHVRRVHTIITTNRVCILCWSNMHAYIPEYDGARTREYAYYYSRGVLQEY